MKTISDNKLDFKTKSIVELNDPQLLDIKGGTTPSTYWCSAVLVSIITTLGGDQGPGNQGTGDVIFEDGF